VSEEDIFYVAVSWVVEKAALDEFGESVRYSTIDDSKKSHEMFAIDTSFRSSESSFEKYSGS
jgi:hypothetical protein